MKDLLISAERLATEMVCFNAGDRRTVTEREKYASNIIHQLLHYIEYLEERDVASESRIGVLKQLNSRYRDHVVQLIHDSDNLKSDLIIMSESNFAKL
jgi:hypothetical protein